MSAHTSLSSSRKTPSAVGCLSAMTTLRTNCRRLHQRQKRKHRKLPQGQWFFFLLQRWKSWSGCTLHKTPKTALKVCLVVDTNIPVALKELLSIGTWIDYVPNPTCLTWQPSAGSAFNHFSFWAVKKLDFDCRWLRWKATKSEWKHKKTYEKKSKKGFFSVNKMFSLVTLDWLWCTRCWLVASVAVHNQWEAAWQKEHQNIKLIVLSEGSGKPSTPAVGSALLYLFRLIHHTTSSPPHRLTETCVRSREPFHIQMASELADQTGCVSDSTYSLVSHNAAITPGLENLRQTPSLNMRTSKRPGQKFAHLWGLLMFHRPQTRALLIRNILLEDKPLHVRTVSSGRDRDLGLDPERRSAPVIVCWAF